MGRNVRGRKVMGRNVRGRKVMGRNVRGRKVMGRNVRGRKVMGRNDRVPSIPLLRKSEKKTSADYRRMQSSSAAVLYYSCQ